jgi:hypothetical protein
MPDQYTPEQRNFLATEYTRRMGEGTGRGHAFMQDIINAFMARWPAAAVPYPMTIRRQYDKQQRHYTVHNLNSINSPGPTHSGRRRTSLTPANVDLVRALAARDADKEEDDPLASPVNTARRNALGLDKSTWNRIMKREHLHPFKMVRSQKLKELDYPRRLAMARFFVTLTPLDLFNYCFRCFG